jgi:hypothetical protein
MKKTVAHIIDIFKFQELCWGNEELIQWTRGSIHSFYCHLLFHKILALLQNPNTKMGVEKRKFANRSSVFITILT